MTRTMWIAIICAAVAFVAYTAWKRTQVAPRVPSSSGGSSLPSSGGGGGLLDSITRTVDKVSGIIKSIGGSAPASAPISSAPSSSEVAWA